MVVTAQCVFHGAPARGYPSDGWGRKRLGKAQPLGRREHRPNHPLPMTTRQIQARPSAQGPCVHEDMQLSGRWVSVKVL
jgi:hypothetical protein